MYSIRIKGTRFASTFSSFAFHRNSYTFNPFRNLSTFLNNSFTSNQNGQFPKICQIHTISARKMGTFPKVTVEAEEATKEILWKEEDLKFLSVFPTLVQDLTEMKEYSDMPCINASFARMLHYNVPHGKRNRGLDTVMAYRSLAKEITQENIQLSFVLGWCVEIFQAYFLIVDDIMDESETRRGRPCWYKLDNLGSSAFNDAALLESSIYILLRKYFGDKPYYAQLLEIFHDVNHKTLYGQSLDTRTALERKMESYTMERYSGIVKYKTSFYSFYMPVALSMTMAGIKDPQLIQQVKNVTFEIGYFFQVQDDYLDCFGESQTTGKIGTDIVDCKCSWLFLVAKEKCRTEEETKILLDNYGNKDGVERIKQLYIHLGLPQLYNQFEEQSYNLICINIQKMSKKLPKTLFIEMVDKIFGRSR